MRPTKPEPKSTASEPKSTASAVTVIHAEVTPAQPSAEHCTTCGNPWPASGPCPVDGTTRPAPPAP